MRARMPLDARSRNGQLVPVAQAKLLQQAAEKPLGAVILSAAKNLCSCSFNELRRSFVACSSSG
jgi:hypothetical protein